MSADSIGFFVAGILFVAGVALLFNGISTGADRIRSEQGICEGKGGVHVRTYDGFACIDAKVIK